MIKLIYQFLIQSNRKYSARKTKYFILVSVINEKVC